MQGAVKDIECAVGAPNRQSPLSRLLSPLRQWRPRLYLICGCFFILFILSGSQPKQVAHALPYISSYNDKAVTNDTLGFEKILVISMPSRHDKRDAISLSASVTGLDFEWVDGVDGASVIAKAKPSKMTKMLERDNGTFGCWRAHMNALQHIVKDRIQTALIMEDDTDWDVNVKQQLVDFARGARYIQDSQSRTLRSPYGHDWDILWLGHCGVTDGLHESQRMYVTRDDPTAIPPELFEFRSRMPDLRHPALDSNFSRVVFRAKSGLCANAYAVSLAGARRILNQETQFARVADIALSDACSDAGGAKCVSVWPSLFNPYRAPGPVSKDSDRQDFGDQWRETGMSYHVVFPTRMNMDALVRTGGIDRVIKSQWPDKTLLSEFAGDLELPTGAGVDIDEREYYNE